MGYFSHFSFQGGYPPFWNKNYNYLLQNILEVNYAMPSHLWKGISNEAKELIKIMASVEFTSSLHMNIVLSCALLKTCIKNLFLFFWSFSYQKIITLEALQTTYYPTRGSIISQIEASTHLRAPVD